MSDLKANKSVVLRLAEAFNDRQLDLLEDVLHREFRGRGISAFPPADPGVGPGARRNIYTIRDDKILEDAIMTDALAILQQLGVAPSA